MQALAASDYGPEQRDAWALALPDLDAWRRRLNARSTFLAEIDGKLAGFVAFEANGRIDLLSTSPSYARRGVASALLHCAERAMAAAGVTEIFAEASLTVQPFFRARGYRVEREETTVVRGVEFRRFRMFRSAASSGYADGGGRRASDRAEKISRFRNETRLAGPL